MPVEKVTGMLTAMWDAQSENGGGGPSDFRASQMNLVLHFGLKTTEAEANARFDQAIRFAQRYPCRIVVLCPEESENRDVLLEGKLFSQCYIGAHLRDVCCCEALILGYRTEESDFLDNQVSLWLEPDLPVYHWFNRVPAERIEHCYLNFLKQCTRVLYDRSIEGSHYDSIDWPDPHKVRDLAQARTLPIRQHIGNFLSVFDPGELVKDLESVTFTCLPEFSGETEFLLNWHHKALTRCAEMAGEQDITRLSLKKEVSPEAPNALRIDWSFSPEDKELWWEYDASNKTGHAVANLNMPRHDHHFHIEPLGESIVLAEALFF